MFINFIYFISTCVYYMAHDPRSSQALSALRSDWLKYSSAQLIERFYDPTEGSILVDGVDITNFDPKYALPCLPPSPDPRANAAMHPVVMATAHIRRWYRRQIGLVSQEPALFSGTIAENIAYGRPGASMDTIVACAKKVF